MPVGTHTCSRSWFARGVRDHHFPNLRPIGCEFCLLQSSENPWRFGTRNTEHPKLGPKPWEVGKST
eukprot:3214392-Amphidinium_carterae.1